MDQTSVNTWDSLVSPPSLVTLHNIISMNQGSNVTKISHFLLEQQQKLMLVLGSLFMKFLFPIKVMTHVLAPGTMVVRESGGSVTYFQVDNWGDICSSAPVSLSPVQTADLTLTTIYCFLRARTQRLSLLIQPARSPVLLQIILACWLLAS